MTDRAAHETKPTSGLLLQLSKSLVCAFMNAPQVDAKSARVPVDLIRAGATRLSQQPGSYWAASQQLPVATTCT